MDCVPGRPKGGIRCPSCFVRRAWDKGLTEVNWSLVPVPKNFCVKVPLEGRVVPVSHYFQGEPLNLVRQWYASFIDSNGDWTTWESVLEKRSALFAGSAPRGRNVHVDQVSHFNTLSGLAIAVPVVHRVVLFARRVVKRCCHLCLRMIFVVERTLLPKGSADVLVDILSTESTADPTDKPLGALARS